MISERELTVTTPTDSEIVLKRALDAPRRLVFEAYTNPKYIGRWMTGPGGWSLEVCEVDLQVGGKWHYVWRKAEGDEMEMSGAYQEIAPPARLVWSEAWGAGNPDTITTLILEEEGGVTWMTFTKKFVSMEARDMALKSGMKEGVAISFRNLDRVLASIQEEA